MNKNNPVYESLGYDTQKLPAFKVTVDGTTNKTIHAHNGSVALRLVLRDYLAIKQSLKVGESTTVTVTRVS